MSTNDMPMDMEDVGLTDEQLEMLAGGKLDQEEIDGYVNVMRIFKERGWTKDRFVAKYSYLGNEPGDIAELADKYWDTCENFELW